MPRHPLWHSPLKKVIPRATLQPAHPALVTVNGGPLPVKHVTQRAGDTGQMAHELFAPRFTAIVDLPPSESVQLRTGQTGRVSYRDCSESIGAHLYHTVARWVRERIHPSVVGGTKRS